MSMKLATETNDFCSTDGCKTNVHKNLSSLYFGREFFLSGLIQYFFLEVKWPVVSSARHHKKTFLHICLFMVSGEGDFSTF